MIKYQLYFPTKKYETSIEKVESFFPLSTIESEVFYISMLQFPKQNIQMKVKPWPGSNVEYVICMKSIEPFTKKDMKFIHQSKSMIQFFHTNEPNEIMADLIVL